MIIIRIIDIRFIKMTKQGQVIPPKNDLDVNAPLFYFHEEGKKFFVHQRDISKIQKHFYLMYQFRQKYLSELTKEKHKQLEEKIKSELTFSPKRIAKISTDMVENARKRHAEHKDKMKQVEKVIEKEYTFRPQLISKPTDDMVERSRRRAQEYAIKIQQDRELAKMKVNDSLEKKDFSQKKKPKDIIIGPADKKLLQREPSSPPKQVTKISPTLYERIASPLQNMKKSSFVEPSPQRGLKPPTKLKSPRSPKGKKASPYRSPKQERKISSPASTPKGTVYGQSDAKKAGKYQSQAIIKVEEDSLDMFSNKIAGPPSPSQEILFEGNLDLIIDTNRESYAVCVEQNDIVIKEDPVRENKNDTTDDGEEANIEILQQEIEKEQMEELRLKEIEEKKKARRSKYFDIKAPVVRRNQTNEIPVQKSEGDAQKPKEEAIDQDKKEGKAKSPKKKEVTPKREAKSKKVIASPKAITTQPEDRKGMWKPPPPKEEPVKKVKKKRTIESATVVKKVDLVKAKSG